MLSMLIAYDATGAVVATLDHVVAKDAEGNVTGLVDFEAHEAAGGKLRDIWTVDAAAGSGTWPEWIGARAHDFTVELGPDKRIAALIHGTKAKPGIGHRRERAAIEGAIHGRVAAAKAVSADGAVGRLTHDPQHSGEGSIDIQDLVGGPGRPLVLDDQGRTVGRSPTPGGTPAGLPVVGRETFEVR